MDTLATISEGDCVAIYTNKGLDLKKGRAERCTKTRISVDDKQYLRSDGRRFGVLNDPWHGPYEWIEAWDDNKHPSEEIELKAEKMLAKSRQYLANFDWRSVSQEQANAVFSVLQSFGIKVSCRT